MRDSSQVLEFLRAFCIAENFDRDVAFDLCGMEVLLLPATGRMMSKSLEFGVFKVTALV